MIAECIAVAYWFGDGPLFGSGYSSNSKSNSGSDVKRLGSGVGFSGCRTVVSVEKGLNGFVSSNNEIGFKKVLKNLK